MAKSGRGAQALEVQVMLLEKPGAPWEPPPPPPGLRREQEPFGFAVEDSAAGDGEGRGVRISSIDLRSYAYRAGVREGDLLLEIDGRAVADKAAYRKAVSETADIARLYVRRGGKTLFFGVRREAPLSARGGAH